MIIAKTPFRMSFFGGGTDMPNFFNEHGGAVISTTFDKYCYVIVRHLPRFFEYTNELVYSRMERVTTIDQIEHPLIRNAMKLLDMHEIRLSYEADLPARTGLGTSSAFAVGLLNAFYAMKGKYIDKHRLADEAIYVERTMCKEAGGLQDQIAVAYGGLNRIDFGPEGYEVRPVILPTERKQRLNDNLMLFYTGISRFSSQIQAGTEEAIQDDRDKRAQLRDMLALVDEAEHILIDTRRDLNDFGRLLDETWRLKRGINNGISTDRIDQLYERALANGALGGKLLGAGGGGFLLFYVEKEHQAHICEALPELLHVPFEFENNGSRIIHFAPEIYTLDENVRDYETGGSL